MQQSPGFLTKRRIYIALGALLVGLLIVLLYLIPGWGFGSYIDARGEIVPRKTLWDWLNLLIVPLILAVGGLWINSSIQRSERERADDRLNEQALQTYFDRMSELMLKNQFDNPTVGDNAKTVARAWTMTTLRGLNGERKPAILQFLYESHLIGYDMPSIAVREGDFSEADRPATIDLSEADLSESHLAEARLGAANLQKVNLERANLAKALLIATNLMDVHLERANLAEALLCGANLERANLEQANLERANLAGANLAEANLVGANLAGANLASSNVPGLFRFRGAILTGAIVTQEQLNMAILDETTILPDGSYYKPPASP